MIRAGQDPCDSLRVVRLALEAYAERGVFRGLCERTTRRGMSVFHFEWLAGRPMALSVDTTKHVLRFRQLLPGVPARSALYEDLKSFIAKRHDNALPEHRRVDRRRAAASCTSRTGSVSISLAVKPDQYAYGVNRIVNLVHELFVRLRDGWPEYLAENFDVRED